MTNRERRELLDRHRASKFPGSIVDVLSAARQGRDLLSEFEQQQSMQVAQTPQQQQQGLRPAHQAGNVNQSMAFPNVPPNTPFNTMGMKAPIDIKKFDEQGHLVRSYDNVPPGVQNLPTGPQRGTVIETPSRMQAGGFNDTMQQYAQYSNLNPELAASVANMPQRNDRLTSFTDTEMTRNANRQNTRIDQTSLDGAKNVAGNVVQYHKDKPLDALGMDLAVLGQVPLVGEVADLANAGISGARGIYNTAVGDTAKAKEQFALAGLSAASAIPFAGNAVGAARIAKAGHNIAHKAHSLEKGVIGAKGFKASTYQTKQSGGRKLQAGTPPSFGIDSELLKAGIAGTESSSGVNMMNPGSTATGLYGQRFSEIRESYPGTRKEFSTNIAAQDSIFDKRLYKGLNDEKSMINNLEHMYKNYPDQIAEKGYSAEQLAGIINMLGRQGTRKYLGNVVRDKKDLATVFPGKYGPNVPEEKKNKTPDEYAKTMQWWIDKYAKDNCPGGECEKTTQTRKYLKPRK
jgi:uncharacterized membrane protein (UPF0127 family)